MADAQDTVWLPVLPSMKGFGPALVKGAGSEADKSGKSVGQRFGKALVAGTAVVGAAGIAAGAALYKVGEVFDDVADTIRVGTGATGESLDALVDSAKRVGSTVPAEFEAIGPVVADVNTRMGLTGETLEKVASQYLHAGNILGEAVDVKKTSAAFNAFKIEGEDVVGAMDHLFQVSQATGLGMNELAEAAAKNAPAMQTLGFSFEETTAMVGSFDKAGLNSSALMASMGKGLVTLAKDGEKPQEAFKRVQGEIAGFIAKGDEAGALNLASKVFGTKGATQFVGALKNGTLNLEDMSKVAGQTGDTIIGAGEDTMDFAEQWLLFKNKILVWLEPMATKVFGVIGTLMGEITSGVEAFGAAWEYNDGEITSSGIPGLMERLGFYARQTFDYITITAIPAMKALAGWIRENATTIGVIAGVITTLMLPVFARLIVQATISGAVQVAAWAAAQGGAVKTAALYVINSYKMVAAWVRMGIAAIVSGAQTAAIWLMYRLDAIKAAASMVLSAAKIIGQWVLMGVQSAINAAKMAVGWVIGVGIPAVAAAATMAIQVALIVGGWVLMGVQSLIQAARMAAAWFIALGPVGWVIAAIVGLAILVIANWDKISAWTKVAWEAVVGFVVAAWNRIKTFIAESWINIKTTFNTIITFIKTVLAVAFTWFKDSVVTPVWNGIKSIISGAWTGIKGTFNAVLTFLRDTLGPVFTWLRDSVIKPVWDKISSIIKGVWENGIKPILDTIAKVLKGDFAGAFQTAKDAIDRIWKGVANVVRKPINFVIGTVYNQGIKKVFDKVAGIVGIKAMPNASEIPAFAKGGKHKGGWALVGEEGPELVNFSNPGRVYTAAETQGMLAGKEQAPHDALPMLAGASPSTSNVAAGGILGNLKNIWNSGIDWVRGGLAKAAELVINPIKGGLRAALGTEGFGGMISGTASKILDGSLSWLRGKDNEAPSDGGFAGSYDGPMGKFHRPSNGPYTSMYGPRWGAFHAGVDIAGGGKTFAALNGVVKYIGKGGGLPGRTGHGIRLAHGGGFETYYGHNPYNGVRVRQGQQVKAGQHIGYQGNTGNVTGTHLHFETLKGGRAVNPMAYLHDNGGVLNPGLSMILNKTKKPEAIYNHEQNRALQTLAARGSAQGFPSTAILRIDDKEFTAHLVEVSDRHNATQISGLRQTRRQTSGIRN